MARKHRNVVVRMADLEIDPEQLEAYTALLREEIEASVRIEPGVLQLSAVELKDQPGRIRILEVYASPAAYEAHLRSPPFLKYKAATAKMVVSLNLFEATPIALAATPEAPGQTP